MMAVFHFNNKLRYLVCCAAKHTFKQCTRVQSYFNCYLPYHSRLIANISMWEAPINDRLNLNKKSEKGKSELKIS